ncbi:hypothetical protein BKA63DRAFT_272020 [Paraphoma chrysanthemicola]|nr:hypothetical protein BKA63DRAFT_272020 [Paraphoma chrysanthemicola]
MRTCALLRAPRTPEELPFPPEDLSSRISESGHCANHSCILGFTLARSSCSPLHLPRPLDYSCPARCRFKAGNPSAWHQRVFSPVMTCSFLLIERIHYTPESVRLSAAGDISSLSNGQVTDFNLPTLQHGKNTMKLLARAERDLPEPQTWASSPPSTIDKACLF